MTTHAILIPAENLVGSADGALVAGATELHIYCPVCGDVWAHCLPHILRARVDYEPYRCRAHGNGSLRLHLSLVNMSENLLRREVLLLGKPLLANNGLSYAQLNQSEP